MTTPENPQATPKSASTQQHPCTVTHYSGNRVIPCQCPSLLILSKGYSVRTKAPACPEKIEETHQFSRKKRTEHQDTAVLPIAFEQTIESLKRLQVIEKPALKIHLDSLNRTAPIKFSAGLSKNEIQLRGIEQKK